MNDQAGLMKSAVDDLASLVEGGRKMLFKEENGTTEP